MMGQPQNNIKSNLSDYYLLIIILFNLFFSGGAFGEKLSNKDNLSSVGKYYMAVTSDSYATDAANDVLENGGSAADAAIAAQLVLGLTEPQGSGLGGGAFVLYFDNQTKKILSIDAREVAPSSTNENLFIDSVGNVIDFKLASLSGKSVGIPGTPALIGHLHKHYGILSMDELSSYSLKLATQGFYKSKSLKESLNSNKMILEDRLDTNEYFFSSNLLKNEKYGNNLINLSKNGYEIFYKPPISQNIIKAVRKNNGIMTQDDFDNYKIIEREAVCDDFLEYKICSMGEPSSGALTMLQILKLIEFNPTWHNYIEASKLAFADRNFYMADPDFVNTPAKMLLDNNYIHKRRKLITENIIRDPMHGHIDGFYKNTDYGFGPEESGTSHISIVDKYGNIISMTSTIESSFGSKIMANGYLLNNELTDFSFIPKNENGLVANRVQPGKRPRSSMTPTIVFDKSTNEPILVIGSAGGSRIIGHVTQRIIDVLYHKKSLGESISAPHLLSRGDGIEAESITSREMHLKEMGHEVRVKKLQSGINAIYFNKNLIYGEADPRRHGKALGK